MSAAVVGTSVAGAVAGSLVSSALAPSGGSAGAAAAADPFAGQRPQYQTMLQQLMASGDPATSFLNNTQNPSAMLQPGYNFQSSDPSYKWRLDQGMQATDNKLAASGLNLSGNRMTALMDYAQGSASQEFRDEFNRQTTAYQNTFNNLETDYSNQFSRLAQLSGANSGQPAAAGQILNQGVQAQQAGASAIGNAVGNAVQQGAGYFMNGSAPANGTGTTYGETGSVTPYNFSSGVSDPSYGAGGGGYSFFGYGG